MDKPHWRGFRSHHPLLPSVLAGSGQSPTATLFSLSGSRVRENFETPEWTKKNFDDLRGDNEAGLTLGLTVGAMAVDRYASGATARQ